MTLARSLTGVRPDMKATEDEVEAVTRVAGALSSPRSVELAFEEGARRLRAGWLRSVAAETARVLRSPTEHEIHRLARTSHDAFGYERDFQPERLEARCRAFFGPAPHGWTAEHVLFSSGQAALATILLQLGEGRPAKLRVAHLGAYFETGELARRAGVVTEDLAHADCVMVEPIACDGRFATHDPAAIAEGLAVGQTLVLDETLSAPRTLAPAVLAGGLRRDVVVMRLVSGLKLLQQGLELANVGVVTVFAPDSGQAASLAGDLRRCRTLTGAGLRYVDALALEAPFFLDPAATATYTERVFAHNAALMRAVMDVNRCFKPLGETVCGGAAPPYCAFELISGNSAEALEASARHIDREAEARELLVERGGSFGFRGHRYDVIKPETGAEPFLRVAMGARDDRSCRGIIALMAELAADGWPAAA